MGGFLLRRLGAALVVLLLASILVFLGGRALPGDPATALGAENRDPVAMAAIRHHYGLDQPLPIQYVKWLGLALQGDLGRDQRELPVAQTIVERLPMTIELSLLAIFVGDRDRDPRRDHRRGPAAQAGRLRRDAGALVGLWRAALLARADDDQPLRGQPALASGERLRAVHEDPVANLGTW